MRLLSPIGSIMRGSLAGLTFSANQYHQIIVRQRTSPVNPKTTEQEIMRIAFSAASVSWKGLTQAVRDAWDAYAETVKYPGPLGDYSVPGRNIFMANLALVGYINNRDLDTIIVSSGAPIDTGVPSWSNVSFEAPSVPGTGFSIKLGNDSGSAMNYFITHSIGFDPSRQRYKGPFLTGTAVSDEVADQATADVDFLGLTEDKRYFARIKGVTVGGAHRQTFEVIVNGLGAVTAI